MQKLAADDGDSSGGRSPRSSDETSSASSTPDSSDASSSNASFSAPQEVHIAEQQEEPQAPESKKEEVKEYECPWFQDALDRNPILRKYAAAIKSAGYGRKQTITFLSIEDMGGMNIPPGVRKLLESLKTEAES